MYLSRFRVKNYKCLGDIDIPLTPIHVLIGENDAGKTSLLEAMAAFFGSGDANLAGVFPQPWSGRELVYHRSAHPEIGLEGHWQCSSGKPAEHTYEQLGCGLAIHFRDEPAKRSCSLSDLWFESNGNILPPDISTTIRGAGGLHSFATSLSPAVATQLTRYEELTHILKLLAPAPTYRLDARAMALPAAFDAKRKFRLDADGFGLPTMLMDILLHDAAGFVELRSQFCGLFPQFRSVRVEREKGRVRESTESGRASRQGASIGGAVYFETTGGHTVRACHVSDGAILILAFLAMSHLPNPPNLLLLEEPENGIYPKRLGEVITLLKQMVNRDEGVRFPQIIMSTHSPYVLSFFEPEEVTFLSRPPGQPDGPVRARPLRDAPNIRERLAGGEFYLGEIWYNLSEEDLFGEP
jgi:hypothetical protein